MQSYIHFPLYGFCVLIWIIRCSMDFHQNFKRHNKCVCNWKVSYSFLLNSLALMEIVLYMNEIEAIKLPRIVKESKWTGHFGHWPEFFNSPVQPQHAAPAYRAGSRPGSDLTVPQISSPSQANTWTGSVSSTSLPGLDKNIPACSIPNHLIT